MILSAGDGCNLVHEILNDCGKRGILIIGGFTALEVNIGVLSSDFSIGFFRTQRAVTEFFDIFHVEQIFHVGIVKGFNLLDFMRSTEAVENAEERNFALKRGQMGNNRQVMRFLDGCR